MSCYKGWEIDIRKTINEHEAKENMDYPDSTFYRKEKPPIVLKDGDRVYGLKSCK